MTLPYLFLPQSVAHDMGCQWAVTHPSLLHVSGGQLRGIARDSYARDRVFSVPVDEFKNFVLRHDS